MGAGKYLKLLINSPDLISSGMYAKRIEKKAKKMLKDNNILLDKEYEYIDKMKTTLTLANAFSYVVAKSFEEKPKISSITSEATSLLGITHNSLNPYFEEFSALIWILMMGVDVKDLALDSGYHDKNVFDFLYPIFEKMDKYFDSRFESVLKVLTPNADRVMEIYNEGKVVINDANDIDIKIKTELAQHRYDTLSNEWEEIFELKNGGIYDYFARMLYNCIFEKTDPEQEKLWGTIGLALGNIFMYLDDHKDLFEDLRDHEGNIYLYYALKDNRTDLIEQFESNDLKSLIPNLKKTYRKRLWQDLLKDYKVVYDSLKKVKGPKNMNALYELFNQTMLKARKIVLT